MTVEPPTAHIQTGDDDRDPVVARLLQPLDSIAPPDLWPSVRARAEGADLSARPGATDPRPNQAHDGLPAGGGRHQHRWWGTAAAAAVTLLLAGTVAAIVADDDGQRIETPAATSDPLDTDLNGTDQPLRSFPPSVELGPDRRAMSGVPVDAFAVIYAAGAVVVTPEGVVLGHYDGEVPPFIYQPDPPAASLGGDLPAGCAIDTQPEAGTRLFCRNEVGPTVEVTGPDGTRHVIASFPPPPPGADPETSVVGHFVRSYPQPRPEGGRAMLLQMSAECESRLALLVDEAVGTDDRPQGGVISKLDGTSYWDDPWMAGESKALGWNPDGSEAYVWRFNAPCGDGLDAPGIYAYRLDGTARLLIPTTSDVLDVALITGEVPSTSADGATTTTENSGATDRPEGWAEWAGPLRPQRADDPALADDRRRAVEFARTELGMTNPEVLATSIVEPGPNWILTEGDLSVRINPYAAPFSAPATDPEPWKQISATTYWSDGIDALSAKVDDDSGRWQARFGVAIHDAEPTATYTLGDNTIDPGATEPDGFGNAQLTFDLPAAPTDIALLTIRWTDPDSGELIGYQRTLLPPGRFAAG